MIKLKRDMECKNNIEIGRKIEELMTFCLFLLVAAWSKKLPNFAVTHVDLTRDLGHDVPYMG